MERGMLAVVLEGWGDPEVLQIREVPRPRPGPHEVVVKVRASGVNRADLLQRRGKYPAPPGEPQDIPGLEFSGTVEEVGEEVSLWRVGDRVMGILGGGGYAQYVAVHERAAIRVPAGIPLEDAGAIPEAFLTAYDALFRQAALTEGETVLIHAVGSGVGTAALQLAQNAGARSIGTARAPWKLDRALELGLDVAVEGGEDWVQRVLNATGGEGVDVILDLVGGGYLAGNLKVMATGARQVVVGVPSGSRAELDLRWLMTRRALIRGTVLRGRPVEEKLALSREFEHRVVPLFAARKIRPVLHTALPAHQAAEAHRLLEDNRTFGKVVLLWD